MKFYFSSTSDSSYVQFETHSGISFFNVHNSDGTVSDFHSQNHKHSLEDWQLIKIGRFVEIYKQVQAGAREYNAYVLCG